CQQQNGYPPTF
nr:immunoglobulin light chain junction region [Macaca mulatta]